MFERELKQAHEFLRGDSPRARPGGEGAHCGDFIEPRSNAKAKPPAPFASFLSL
jgi:hypothetical protein